MQHNAGDEEGGRPSWFWMVLCCIPMVAIIVLIALASRGGR